MQASEQERADKNNHWVAAILLVGFLFRASCATLLYPGFDEAYYYTYTLHPDWSYFDHPPLVALVTAIGPWLTGQATQFTIRIGSLLLYTGTLWLLYRTAVQLFSRAVGVMTLAIASVVPIFQIAFGLLILPDSPLMFFWAAVLYWATKEFFPKTIVYRPTYRLVVISLLIGLASLGKYHGFALGFGLLAFCLVNARYRSVFGSPWLWLGFIGFWLVFSPVLYWNWQHDWVSFQFQSNRAIPLTTYRPLDALGVFLVQVGYLFPTIGFPLWWITLQTFLRQFDPIPVEVSHSQADTKLKQQLLLWQSLPLMLGFTLIGGYRQILPTWAMPGFFSAIPLLACQAVVWQQQFPKTTQRWLKGSAIAIASLLIFALVHVAFGTLQKPSRYALFGGIWPVQNDPSTQLIDVKQLRQRMTEEPIFKAALQDSSFIFTNDFFVGGQLGMAMGPITDRPVTCFSSDLRGFAFWSKPDEWLGKNGLYMTTKRFQVRDATEQYGEYFRSIQKIGEIPIRRGGAETEVFLIYKADTLLKPFPKPYGLK